MSSTGYSIKTWNEVSSHMVDELTDEVNKKLLSELLYDFEQK